MWELPRTRGCFLKNPKPGPRASSAAYILDKQSSYHKIFIDNDKEGCERRLIQVDIDTGEWYKYKQCSPVPDFAKKKVRMKRK